MGANFSWGGAFAISVMLAATPAPAASLSTCSSPAQVDKLFPDTDTAEYSFTGPEGQRLAAELDAMVGTPGKGVSFYVVYLPDFSDFFLFSVTADGCFGNRALGFKWAEVDRLFKRADVSPPFGATYYQLPSVRA